MITPHDTLGHTQKAACCICDCVDCVDPNNPLCPFSITPPRRRKPCLGRNIEDSDADLYAEYHEGKMTPESTSSSEGSSIERSRAFERRVERNRLVMERQSELTPDLASTINTDFASMAPQPAGGDGQGFDFQGWFQGVYEEHHRRVRETPPQARDQRVHSATDGTFLAPPDDHRARSWSQGGGRNLLAILLPPSNLPPLPDPCLPSVPLSISNHPSLLSPEFDDSFSLLCVCSVGLCF